MGIVVSKIEEEGTVLIICNKLNSLFRVVGCQQGQIGHFFNHLSIVKEPLVVIKIGRHAVVAVESLNEWVENFVESKMPFADHTRSVVFILQ